MNSDPKSPAKPTPPATETVKDKKPPEYGGRKGPEPTRYGDWENGGKCVDF